MYYDKQFAVQIAERVLSVEPLKSIREQLDKLLNLPVPDVEYLLYSVDFQELYDASMESSVYAEIGAYIALIQKMCFYEIALDDRITGIRKYLDKEKIASFWFDTFVQKIHNQQIDAAIH